MSKTGERIEQISTVIDNTFNTVGDALNRIKDSGWKGMGAIALSASALFVGGAGAFDASPSAAQTSQMDTDQSNNRIDGSLNGANERANSEAKGKGSNWIDTGKKSNTEDTSSDSTQEAEDVKVSFTEEFNKLVDNYIAEQKKAGNEVKKEDAVKIVDFNVLNLFNTLEDNAKTEKVIQDEISPDAEAALNEVGLNKEDVTLVKDVDSTNPGVHETGKNSFNHADAPTTPSEALKQWLSMLNAEDGFTKEDSAVVRESLISRGIPSEAVDAIASGDFSNLQITSMFLNTPGGAVYEDIDFNNQGKLDTDNLREVGKNDAIEVITVTLKDGTKKSIVVRVDCGKQPFDRIKVVTKNKPTTPVVVKPPRVVTPPPATATPPETPPTTVVKTYKVELEVCVGFYENGEFRFETVSGEGTSQEKAQENAQELYNILSEKYKGACDVIATSTSTTTSTTQPNTSTSTSSTTEPDKDPTRTTIPVSSTTVPVTEPDTTEVTRPPAEGNEASSPTSVPARAGRYIVAAVKSPFRANSWNSTKVAIGLGMVGLGFGTAFSRKRVANK